jgi:hypothetical protein
MPLDPPGPVFASWIERVAAAVLDGAIGTGATFLAFGDQPARLRCCGPGCGGSRTSSTRSCSSATSAPSGTSGGGGPPRRRSARRLRGRCALLFVPSSGYGPLVLACGTTASDDHPIGLSGGTLTPGSMTTTRLGVTRQASGSGAQIAATWEWSALPPATSKITLRASFARADGTGARHYDFPAPDRAAQEATISLPVDALEALATPGPGHRPSSSTALSRRDAPHPRQVDLLSAQTAVTWRPRPGATASRDRWVW